MAKRKQIDTEIEIESKLPEVQTGFDYSGEDMTSVHPQWSDYVLNFLTEEELFNGCPRVDGLRRLVEKLISPIVRIDVDVQPLLSPHLVIIAKATVFLENGYVHSSCADASMYNTDSAFKQRLTAMADGRAKSKAFREILRLRNVYSSEEATQEVVEREDDMLINDSQIALITNILPKKLEVKFDFDKLVSNILGKEKSLRTLTHNEAIKVLNIMNDYIKNRENIPAEAII